MIVTIWGLEVEARRGTLRTREQQTPSAEGRLQSKCGASTHVGEGVTALGRDSARTGHSVNIRRVNERG